MEAPTRQVVVREATSDDAEHCGRIFYDAFESIAACHNLPVEPGSPEFTRFKVKEMLAGEGFVGLVAEREGQVLGSAFVDERATIAGIGPVTVDTTARWRSTRSSASPFASRYRCSRELRRR